jgi:hypothetical protein
MPDTALPSWVTDYYALPRLDRSGEHWIGITHLTFGRGRIVRGRLDDPDFGIDDGW